ncbi:hypothetical protein QBC34DRAFT_163638 [Podospora aff. communis PSN243]|uniref:Glycosyltransferase Family 8 n=1 Tax=Podospora aff. communis PSN243 TaxID=3040156 RepID=A0AAV9GAT6_9PEZI|nr:hypothetical protein QBC34DRAFT_163638 [Podospora aff. communis PSN243]
MLVTMPSQRQVVGLLACISIASFFLTAVMHRDAAPGFLKFHDKHPAPAKDAKEPKRPTYKPVPEYIPPPIKDNFPLLSRSSQPPPIPKWNVPQKDLHKKYDLPIAPPLLIGFSRSWPILLQAVVSYLTAGWPADQIYVVENTGVQQANTRGQLSLQNPFHLNHTTLKTLGVNIIQTPTLLSFAQLQNFYLSLTYSHDWPYYFWSHMDVLALSYEDGHEMTPKYNEEGYKSLYTLALQALQQARKDDPRWGIRFFAYDHLALVNPEAYEDVGGWDTMIPYYITDCDMHSRLAMRNWTMKDAKAGIITDVSTTLDDLAALYRLENVETKFTDPNPPPPENEDSKKNARGLSEGVARRDATAARLPPSTMLGKRARVAAYRGDLQERGGDEQKEDENLSRWRKLLKTADTMFHYKHGNRGRNTWQTGQRGGEGEPFYYNAAGLAEAIELTTENGKEVYRRKWGHRDCDLRQGAGLTFGDQWLVEKDW